MTATSLSMPFDVAMAKQKAAIVSISLSFEDLISMDFVTDENEPFILKHWFWYYFKKSVSRFNIVMAIESHQAILDCVRLGMGLAITADHLVMEEIKAGKLIPIFPSKDKVINQISLVELRDKDPTMTEREFQLFLEKKYGQKEVLKSGTHYYKHGFV